MDPIKPKSGSIPTVATPKEKLPSASPTLAADRIDGAGTSRATSEPLSTGAAVSDAIVERFAALVASMGEINGEVAELGDVDIEV